MGVSSSKSMMRTRGCTLWKADRSPACRAVMMVVDAMNLTLNEVDVNMDKDEHKSAELVKMNPRQTLPILKDRDLILCDSNAISVYLATRYKCGKLSLLLPNDAFGRALVDQHMHYNSSIVYPRFKAVSNPILHNKCRCLTPMSVNGILSIYSDMEHMLSGQPYLTGHWPTIGDIVLTSTISTLHILLPVDGKKFPRTAAWMNRMAKEPYYLTANIKGLCEYAKRIDSGVVKKESEITLQRLSTDRRVKAEAIFKDLKT